MSLEVLKITSLVHSLSFYDSKTGHIIWAISMKNSCKFNDLETD